MDKPVGGQRGYLPSKEIFLEKLFGLYNLDEFLGQYPPLQKQKFEIVPVQYAQYQHFGLTRIVSAIVTTALFGLRMLHLLLPQYPNQQWVAVVNWRLSVEHLFY